MELHAEHAVASHDREAFSAVVHGAERGVLRGDRRVAVHEVEVVAIRDIAQPWMVADPADRVPPDLRDARHTRELHDGSAVEPEARLAGILLAPIEQELHADADAEDRYPALACVAQGGREAEAVELTRAVAEVPDARKHDRRRGPQIGWIADELGARAHRRERLADAGEGADALGDD